MANQCWRVLLVRSSTVRPGTAKLLYNPRDEAAKSLLRPRRPKKQSQAKIPLEKKEKAASKPKTPPAGLLQKVGERISPQWQLVSKWGAVANRGKTFVDRVGFTWKRGILEAFQKWRTQDSWYPDVDGGAQERSVDNKEIAKFMRIMMNSMQELRLDVKKLVDGSGKVTPTPPLPKTSSGKDSSPPDSVQDSAPSIPAATEATNTAANSIPPIADDAAATAATSIADAATTTPKIEDPATAAKIWDGLHSAWVTVRDAVSGWFS